MLTCLLNFKALQGGGQFINNIWFLSILSMQTFITRWSSFIDNIHTFLQSVATEKKEWIQIFPYGKNWSWIVINKIEHWRIIEAELKFTFIASIQVWSTQIILYFTIFPKRQYINIWTTFCNFCHSGLCPVPNMFLIEFSLLSPRAISFFLLIGFSLSPRHFVASVRLWNFLDGGSFSEENIIFCESNESTASCRRGTYNSKKNCKIFWSQKVH